MIKIAIKSKSYSDVPVLGRISMTLKPRDRIAVLGPSGIGKSTLLRIAAGLDQGFDGKVVRPEATAIVFQEPTLLPWRSALQNLTLVHRDLTPQAAQEMLERIGLGDKANLFPGQLSLGQQRRLSLARAFAGKPNFLIMDEPFASLDKDTAAEMIDRTNQLLEGSDTAFLLVTHQRQEATALGCKCFQLKGKPAELV